MNRKGLVSFLLISFLIAWLGIGIGWLLGIRPLPETAGFAEQLVFLAVTLPTSFAPALACFAVRKWITKEGFFDSGIRFNLRQSWLYYLLALIYPLFIFPLVWGVSATSGLGRLDVSHLAVGDIFLAMVLSVAGAPIAWGEEFGWRGYLQIRLWPTHALWSAITTGLIWGIWHYPMILMGFLSPQNMALALVLYPINMSITSLLYGWFRARTDSIWPPSLAHSAGNSLLVPMLTASSEGLPWLLVWGGYRLIILGILGVAIATSGQLSPRHISDQGIAA